MAATLRHDRIAAKAGQYKASTALLAVLLFPFQLVGWVAAAIWVVCSFAVAAVAVSFHEASARMRGPNRGG